MKLRKLIVENVRSFLDRAEFNADGDISIVVGPNGGGKTNLLDAAVTVIRRHLLRSWTMRPSPTLIQPQRREIVLNDLTSSRPIEKHSNGADRPQRIEVELEVTEQDTRNMREIKRDLHQLISCASENTSGVDLEGAANWDISLIESGQKLSYVFVENEIVAPESGAAMVFLKYLRSFEVVAHLRAMLKQGPLAMPMLSLPVNRASNGFQSSVTLSNYDQSDGKRTVDAATSGAVSSIAQYSVGRLAEKYRLLLEEKDGQTDGRFYSDPRISELTRTLKSIGYDWRLVSVNPLTNQYDIELTKQGKSFLVGSASSGEREILIYLFGIFALDIRNALLLIDEPELHLHPKWQGALLKIFEDLSRETGNQFILATHSPVFISPESIRYVSRIFSQDQQSRIVRLNKESLPDQKHLFSIINSHNNEKIFFANKVVLVEGLSDRLFFEALVKRLELDAGVDAVVEIVNVNGKMFFRAYEQVLKSIDLPYCVIADLDYLQNIGPEALRALFDLDEKGVKGAIVDASSMDGASFVSRLQEAIETGQMDDLNKIWSYIKSRRRRLRSNLNDDEKARLEEFIVEQERRNIFVLRRGDLESYLPVGQKSKDMDKLIRFLSTDFWSALDSQSRQELGLLLRRVLH